MGPVWFPIDQLGILRPFPGPGPPGVSASAFCAAAGWELAVFLGGKAFFFLRHWSPMLVHPAWAVLPLYSTASLVQGVTLSVVFQLAHCVEEADFSLPRQDTGRMAASWAEHQVESTVDFARGIGCSLGSSGG